MEIIDTQTLEIFAGISLIVAGIALIVAGYKSIN